MTTNIAALVEERQKLRAAHEADLKKFNNHWKPALTQIEQIDAQITAEMHAQGTKSIKTDAGTAILSEILTAKIKVDERDKYIDMCLENWDDFGGEMLQIGAPKADAVRAYMDAHNGQLPPHVESSTMYRFSIRKA